MNSYLLTVVLRNDLEEKERLALLDSVTKKFAKKEKEDLWGSRNLTYPIQHQDKGYYAHYEFESDPKDIASLDNILKLHEDVIRYLLLRK